MATTFPDTHFRSLATPFAPRASRHTSHGASPNAITEEQVVLVDENDVPIGVMDKLEAHRKGALHRAFSVFVFNSCKELLLQKRSTKKYHSGGLWTNTCCSHPRPGEAVALAAQRRLMEEMGLDCDIVHAFSFIYRAALTNGLVEHELDHVFIGWSDTHPSPDTEELEGWKYFGTAGVLHDIKKHPERYTEWFRMCLNNVCEYLEKQQTG